MIYLTHSSIEQLSPNDYSNFLAYGDDFCSFATRSTSQSGDHSQSQPIPFDLPLDIWEDVPLLEEAPYA